MRIAISTEGMDSGSLLDERFGRCNYFYVYDVESKVHKIVENEGQVASGGAGIAAAQQMIDEKVDVVITGSLGPNAFKILSKAGIKGYHSEEIQVEKVLELFASSQLAEITLAGESHKGIHR